MVFSIIDGVTALGTDDAGFAVGVIERADGTGYRLRAGDHLTVWDAEGTVLYAGIIIPVPANTSVGVGFPSSSTITFTAENGRQFHRLPFRAGQLGFPEWATLFVNRAAMVKYPPPADGSLIEATPNNPSLNRALRARVISSIVLSVLYGPISSVYLRPPRLRFIRGKTDPFLEQGSGGVVWWCVARNREPHGPYALDSGDLVIIWGKHRPLFMRMIVRDYSSTVAGGRRVHWLPSGYPPRRWVSFFFEKTTIIKGTEFFFGEAYRSAWVITFPPLPAIGRWLERNINGGSQR